MLKNINKNPILFKENGQFRFLQYGMLLGSIWFMTKYRFIKPNQMSEKEEATSKILRQLKFDADKFHKDSNNLDTAFSILETLEFLSDFFIKNKNKKREKVQNVENEAFINARNEYLKKEF